MTGLAWIMTYSFDSPYIEADSYVSHGDKSANTRNATERKVNTVKTLARSCSVLQPDKDFEEFATLVSLLLIKNCSLRLMLFLNFHS